ncbi:hypothetical protein D0T84_16160 [Dysgonomonas sp. 521]|uniref:hypothetical protein n=1 Tax=Dysgonomonas sp. 521 TaxID=2302932 RepID=UPI0013D61470|nr:hypothetical protein [Dysgonomonas sp. 521]NDV96436.1 hypothetical protein [Dysgonomonas sp. 521]
MKKEEKGILSINMGMDNHPVVIYHPGEAGIWMDKNELCELFGVSMLEIETCTGFLVKIKLFRIEECCRYHMVQKGSRICYDITEVNLEVIIALSFHLESSNAAILRKWFTGQIIKPKGYDFPLAGSDFRFSLN